MHVWELDSLDGLGMYHGHLGYCGRTDLLSHLPRFPISYFPLQKHPYMLIFPFYTCSWRKLGGSSVSGWI